jgi:hypothetical protein
LTTFCDVGWQVSTMYNKKGTKGLWTEQKINENAITKRNSNEETHWRDCRPTSRISKLH